MPTVSIQGQKASFHDIAQKKYFNNGHDIVARDSFAEVFKDVKSGKADFGVVALENSLYGSINKVYDLLRENDFWISGEIYLRIKHNLIGLKHTKIENLKEVHSHPVALAQCEKYLDSKLAHAERFESHDTASGIRDVAKWNDKTKAAIGSDEAAKLHGLDLLAEHIETNPQNYTRFIVLTRDRQLNDKASKTSVILHAANKPGSLHAALGEFAKRDLNLTKLESRPVATKAWHYIFYIDFEAGLEDPKAKEVLSPAPDPKLADPRTLKISSVTPEPPVPPLHILSIKAPAFKGSVWEPLPEGVSTSASTSFPRLTYQTKL